MTDSILEFMKTFFILFFELLALFIVISFIVSLIQQTVSEKDKTVDYTHLFNYLKLRNWQIQAKERGCCEYLCSW